MNETESQFPCTLRHALIQPAMVAMLMFEKVRERNQDPSLKPAISLLESALKDLAEQIEALP